MCKMHPNTLEGLRNACLSLRKHPFLLALRRPQGYLTCS